jgi:DNA invertase Pin-like site-specific DNA recombinase
METTTNTQIKCCLYARKSSESDERQALSIESQVEEMLAQAKRDGINIVDIRRESHSAKNSGERHEYNQMIKDIRNGMFNSILTWSPDRLSRNAGDLGSLIDLMDQGSLVEIRTHGQVFANSPNEKFLLMILGSQAKLENDNRSVNVKRGLRTKCAMGIRPGVAPLGYLNDSISPQGEKQIYLDPERAPIIKEMFEKFAYKGYSGRMLLRWMNFEMNFTTRSGKRIVLSSIYNILANPYYCGKFEFPARSGNWYKVKHESIISEELFNEAQTQVSRVPKSKPGTKEFSFTKILRCGACKSGITAEEKFKRFKNGNVRRYVYYHCTRGANRDCKEPYIREEDLLDQLFIIIDDVHIDKIGAKEKLQKEIERYQNLTYRILGQETNTSSLPKVDLRGYAKHVLIEGTIQEKREILAYLKTKLYLKDQKISLVS